jgi:hypothetical protein
MVPKSFDLFSKPPTADPVSRGTSRSTGAVPTFGINELVPELDVSDLQASLSFWCGLLVSDQRTHTLRRSARSVSAQVVGFRAGLPSFHGSNAS